MMQTKCPKCGHYGETLIVRHHGQKIVFDACNYCGTKTTDEQEENTPNELEKAAIG